MLSTVALCMVAVAWATVYTGRDGNSWERCRRWLRTTAGVDEGASDNSNPPLPPPVHFVFGQREREGTDG